MVVFLKDILGGECILVENVGEEVSAFAFVQEKLWIGLGFLCFLQLLVLNLIDFSFVDFEYFFIKIFLDIFDLREVLFLFVFDGLLMWVDFFLDILFVLNDYLFDLMIDTLVSLLLVYFFLLVVLNDESL